MFYRLTISTIYVILVCLSKTDAINEKTITGKITYTGSDKLDADYRIEILLQDISLMDAPAITVASTIISNVKSFPISYMLKYNPSDIELTNRYSISSRITKPDDSLAFINDVNIRVDFEHEQNSPIDIPVVEVKESIDISRRTERKSSKCSCKKTCSCGCQKANSTGTCQCNKPNNQKGKKKLCRANKKHSIKKQT